MVHFTNHTNGTLNSQLLILGDFSAFLKRSGCKKLFFSTTNPHESETNFRMFIRADS